jgi:hypothetical protein
MGGNNEPQNLVKLTPEEHYVAHQLLVKIYPTEYKLALAAKMMVVNRPSNKLYGWLRRKFSIAQSVLQSGSGNSQYNTCWVVHLDFGSKRIQKELLCEYLEQGWLLGKTLKYIKPKKQRVYVDPTKRKTDVEQYREFYKLYSVVGFEEFVKVTNYKYTKANLVQRFSKLLPEFAPQNGKRRSNV